MIGSQRSNSEQFIDFLRSTLTQLETTSGLPADHPDLLALKTIILGRIAQLELAKVEESTPSQIPQEYQEPQAEIAHDQSQMESGLASPCKTEA